MSPTRYDLKSWYQHIQALSISFLVAITPLMHQGCNSHYETKHDRDVVLSHRGVCGQLISDLHAVELVVLNEWSRKRHRLSGIDLMNSIEKFVR